MGLWPQRADHRALAACSWCQRLEMSNKVCPHCHHPMIEIDPYGERLVGCLECNRWGRPGDATLPMQLLEDGPKNRSGVAEAYSKPIRGSVLAFLNHPSAHQKGGVCNAKYPKSWIVNIAAQRISIRIKARVLNSTTPPQRAHTLALGEALMRRLPLC